MSYITNGRTGSEVISSVPALIFGVTRLLRWGIVWGKRATASVNSLGRSFFLPPEQRSRFLGLTEKIWKSSATIKSLASEWRGNGMRSARFERTCRRVLPKVAENFGRRCEKRDDGRFRALFAGGFGLRCKMVEVCTKTRKIKVPVGTWKVGSAHG